jgi:thioredoxin 1
MNTNKPKRNLATRIGLAFAAACVGVAALSGCTPHEAPPPQSSNSQSTQLPSAVLANIPTVDKANFDAEVLKSSKPVVAYFYFDACHWCQTDSPFVKNVSEAKADNVKFVKVDVNASMKLARQYRATATPTFIIFRDGKPVAEHQGYAPQDELTKWINDSLGLPAGTTVDLTLKTLSDSDKQRLRDAFEIAVNKSPDADKSFTAPDGSQTTLRKAVEKDLNSGAIFEEAENELNATPITVDQLIQRTQTATLTIQPPRA